MTYVDDLRGRVTQIQESSTSATQSAEQISQAKAQKAEEEKQRKLQEAQRKADLQWRKQQQQAMTKMQESQKSQMQKLLTNLASSQQQSSGGVGGYSNGGSNVAGVSGGQNYKMVKGSANFGRFVNAIIGQESGGNYRAINASSGATGKYQIMPANIGPWTKAALGRSLTRQQFINSPKAQDATARYMLKGYYDKWGAAGAAVAWYAGPGTAAKYVRNPGAYGKRQGAYPSINAYAMNVLRRMGQ